MNNLKKISIALFILLLSSSFIHSQDIDRGEFMIVNQTNSIPITVKIYPVGAIFNGDDQYTVIAANKINPQNNYYIFGKEIAISYDQNGNDWYKRANFDKSQDYLYCDLSIGYGRYRIDFYEGTTKTNSCDVDFSDANFTGQDVTGYIQHLRIDYFSSSEITFQFINPYSENVNIAAVNYYIKVWEQVGTENSALTPSKGNFTDSQDPASQYHSFPLDATSFGHFAHATPETVNLNLNVSYYDANIITNKTFHFDNCIFEVDDGKTFTINNNSNSFFPIVISGSNGKFISGTGSVFEILGYDLGIKIENNATVDIDGTIFQPSNINTIWWGLELDAPGTTSIKNCEFNNFETGIYTNANGINHLIISDNIFNFRTGEAIVGIKVEQTSYVVIQNNTFIFPTTNIDDNNTGIRIINNANSENDNNQLGPNNPIISVVNNTFSEGMFHIVAVGLSDNLINVYVADNHHTNGLRNMAFGSASGQIKNNDINSSVELSEYNSYCIYVEGGNPNFLNNTINSYNNNLKFSDYSNPSLGPITNSENQFLWVAGRNILHSTNYYNIYSPNIYTPGYFNTDYGQNWFMLNNNSQYFFGAYLNTPSSDYYSSNNCWYINSGIVDPTNYVWLINTATPPVSMTIHPESQPPYSGCYSWDYQIIDRIITDRGNGIYDTILVTQANNNPPSSEDVALYGTGVKNQKLKNYSSAIINFKNLVNTYPNSKYLEKTIFNLYECYVSSDTNHNQGWRNTIFGDIKSFLESKIQQYENNEAFVNIAFDFLLKCKIKIKNYELAMDGYEFIAENSPSATERLMASINYIDVEGLLQGSGGGQKDNINNSDKLTSNQIGKPIKDILLASYKKNRESKIKREKFELQNSNDAVRTKAEQNKRSKQDKVFENRALENISVSGSLTKKERRERIQKDFMLLSSGNVSSDNFVKTNNITALKYELSQNYPNPFNPITNIKYQIQKTGLVTLRIYDITGREIKTLVNEIKNPGNFIVTFNGSEFASGVYFYRIQSGDFVQVKKMLLIK
ncbi:MAG: T9SS type A sorting domain-containing protein [Ignavibacteria bacterium]|jgi:hypothetical protein